MKKTLFFILLALGLSLAIFYFYNLNKKETKVFDTKQAFITSIERKTVATGKVVPLEEIEVKPQISGIIDKLHVEEGAIVKKGDLIATVRVVADEQSLNSANGNIKSARISYDNAKIQYNRQKALYDKGVVSRQDFESAELQLNNTKQQLDIANSTYRIIKKGSAGGGASNTNIRAEISGTILEIPVKEGSQVIESNTMNAGTTITVIADMTKMIFEGKVDESEVTKLEEGTDLDISLAAIDNKKIPAILSFIATKGTDEGGAVQFKIKANLLLEDNYYLRAGYSANAEIVLEKKDSILAIKESLLQFERDSEIAFIEVQVGDQEFEKREIDLGLSNGIEVEILSGIDKTDKIKVWNKASEEDSKTFEKRR